MPIYPDPNSVVDFLKNSGQASDYYSRAKLYGELGLAGGEAGYKGAGANNASQNNALLAALRARSVSGSPTGSGTSTPGGTTTPPPAAGAGATNTTVPGMPSPTPGSPIPSPYTGYDQALRDYQTLLKDRGEPTPEQLADKQRRIQEITDAINSEYNILFANEEKAGKDRSARTRALNITAGNAGGSFASAGASKTDKVNQEQMDFLVKEKASKLAAAITGVEDRMSSEWRRQREEALAAAKGNAELEKQFIDEQRSRANDTIAGIAGAGMSWSQLKDQEPDIYKQLLEEYGGDEYAMNAAYNASLPSEFKVQYENKIIRGKEGNAVMLRYGFDPVTKRMTTNEFDLGVSYDTYADQEPIELGKGQTLVVPDGKGGYKTVATGMRDDGDTTVYPKGTISSGSLKVTPDQLSAIQKHLTDTTVMDGGYSIRGKDGYTDPYVYQEAMNDWVEEGGLEKDFLSKFPPSNYINPASNPNLPAALRNNKNPLPKVKAGASGSNTTASGLPRP